MCHNAQHFRLVHFAVCVSPFADCVRCLSNSHTYTRTHTRTHMLYLHTWKLFQLNLKNCHSSRNYSESPIEMINWKLLIDCSATRSVWQQSVWSTNKPQQKRQEQKRKVENLVRNSTSFSSLIIFWNFVFDFFCYFLCATTNNNNYYNYNENNNYLTTKRTNQSSSKRLSNSNPVRPPARSPACLQFRPNRPYARPPACLIHSSMQILSKVQWAAGAHKGQFMSHTASDVGGESSCCRRCQ